MTNTFAFLIAAALVTAGCGSDHETGAATSSANAPKSTDWPEAGDPYSVAGRVTDSTGHPLAGVKIHLGQVNGCLIQGPGGEATTGSDGGFRIDGLARAGCHVWIAMDGYARFRGDVPPGEGAMSVTLHRPGLVEGVVVGPAGTPVSARIENRTDELPVFGNYPSIEIDASGRFRYDGLPPGRFHIRVYTNEGHEADLELNLVAGEERRGLRLTPASPWDSYARIRVRDAAGKRVDPATLKFFCSDLRPHVVPDGDGLLLAYRHDPGTPATVRIWRNEEPVASAFLKSASLPIAASTDIVLQRPVHVRFEADPPAEGGTIDASIWFGDWELEGPLERLSPSCVYDISVCARGRMTWTRFDWRPPARDGVVSVPLPARATEDADGERKSTAVDREPRRVRGRVLDESGDPVGGARISFLRARRAGKDPLDCEDCRDAYAETYSHADGRFGFRVPGAAGFLFVQKSGFGITPVQWDGRASRVDVTLPRPALLSVTGERGPARDDVLWICAIRWPRIHPTAVWLTDWLPLELEVAPGLVEVTGRFKPYKITELLRPEHIGERVRSVRCAQGKTTEVAFRR